MAGRALVLGGGGVTGVAWELGMLAGLAQAGVDLPAADLVVGTSAGSVVGAQVASGLDLSDRYAVQLDGKRSDSAASVSTRTLARLGWTLLRCRDGQRARARIGRMALAATTEPEAQRRAVIEARLPVRTWPERPLLITAVDAESGEFAAFERDSGVGLVDAVAASCAVPGVWPPVTIGGRRWIDGGMRSAANVDLAAECERVVVLAPVTGGFGSITRVSDQVGELRRHARVAVVAPDKPARQAIGGNVLDPARRAPAARAGYAQATAAVEEVAEVWSGSRVRQAGRG